MEGIFFPEYASNDQDRPVAARIELAALPLQVEEDSDFRDLQKRMYRLLVAEKKRMDALSAQPIVTVCFHGLPCH